MKPLFQYFVCACVLVLSGCASTTPEQVSSSRKPTNEELAAARQAEIARLEEKLKRDIEAYNNSSRTVDPRFAEYLRQWSAKVESVGNANYPEEARGRLYGDVRISVTIRPDGSVESAVIDRSSGHDVLDQAALRIVRLASPFAPLPPEIRRDTDLLVITRTWHFARGDRMGSDASGK